MTKRWNNDENDEDRKMKYAEERKTWQIFTYESRYIKKIWQGEKRTKRWKKDKKMTKRWNDDEMMMHSLT